MVEELKLTVSSGLSGLLKYEAGRDYESASLADALSLARHTVITPFYAKDGTTYLKLPADEAVQNWVLGWLKWALQEGEMDTCNGPEVQEAIHAIEANLGSAAQPWTADQWQALFAQLDDDLADLLG